MKSLIYNLPIFIAILLSGFSNYKVFKSFQDQLPLLADFNLRQENPILTIDQIESYQDFYPNLNNTIIPIKQLKANYYVRDNNLEKTLEYSAEGDKLNPFLFIGDFQRGRVYYNLNKIDSSYVYLKKAAAGLPRNQSHITHFQKTLARLSKMSELDSLFEKVKDFSEEAVWQNQMYFISVFKTLKEGYNYKDSLYVEQALKKFPNNRIIKIAHQTIVLGLDKIGSANLFDQEALKFYKEKDYSNAVRYWQKAIEIIPEDQAYYFNIARSLTLSKNFKRSDSILVEVKGKSFLVDNGELEFLRAMNYIDNTNENKFKICNLLKESKAKGHKPAENILRQLEQQVGCL